MRRIASFVARRADQPDAPSTTSSTDTDPLSQDANKRKVRIFNSLSRKLAPPSRPVPLLASDSAHSSSSASSGSAEPRTPVDEVLPRTLSQRGSWKSWLGAKKHQNEDLKAAVHLPPTSAIALRPPSRFYDTDDTSSELEDDLPVQNLVESITQARNNMRAMILNSSVDRPSCPPLLDIPGSSSFPRSCLLSKHVHRRNTMESKMHKAALLRMLESHTPAEERSIAPLGARPAILVKEAQAHNPDIDTWPKAQHLRRISGGLGSWVTRPCFEDRVLVWTRQEPSGQIVSADVAGSQFGVAALEFSELLHILAGYLPDVEDDFDPIAELQLESPPDSGVAAVALPSSDQSTASVTVADSELSQALLTLAVDIPNSTETSESTQEKTSLKQAEPAAPRVKRGVRFAEDDKDDQIPLGYVLRIKKQREEKARFLREEREKRELEERKRTREEERQLRLLEAEKKQQEKERRVLELQKKAMEEEKRRQNYAMELQASRARSEASRVGHISSSSSLVRDIERDRSASRDARPSPSARQRTLVPTANLSPYDGSPSSSMPATPQGSQRSFSRPPSVYSTHTTSSEDARARDGRRISRRSTLAYDSSKQSPLPNPHVSLMPYNYNPWMNMQVPPGVMTPVPVAPMMTPVSPMMTPVSYFPMDTLVPPSPPFMMNQFGNRPRSNNFLQSQVSSSPYNNSSNHSADSIHHPSHAALNSPGLFSAHQRRASDEARGHSRSVNALADRTYASQTDLRHKRSSHATHISRGSSLHHSHQRPPSVHSHTSPARPVSTSQPRSTPTRHQSAYS